MSLEALRAEQVANPYLEDVLAPVTAELTVTDLRVTGRIPDYLDGQYLRNGANPVTAADPATYHWFTGDPMVHGVGLGQGRAHWYRNRWVRTPGVCAALGEALPARMDVRAGMQSVGPNTNVLRHAGKTLALVEGGVANYELTADLDTVGTCDFDGTLRGGYTAHPHRDPVTGELHAISYSFARGKTVQYSVIDTAGRARRTVDIEVTGSPMMHDFSLTDKYVVVYDLPVTFDSDGVLPGTMPRWIKAPTRKALGAMVGRFRVPGPVLAMVNRDSRPPAGLPYAWNPDYPARIGVMPREGGAQGRVRAGDAQVRWFDVEPCYVFHPLNAYTEVSPSGQELLVLDVVRYAKVFDEDRRGPGDAPPTLDRWTINLDTGAVHYESRDDRPQEFPKINESLLGRKHRFGYTVGVSGGIMGDAQGVTSTSLYKHDYATGSSLTAPLDRQLVVGEMTFVPRPGGRDEDDGVLIGLAHHRGLDEGQLVILDAATCESVATVHLPQRVPMGFHGNWTPAD